MTTARGTRLDERYGRTARSRRRGRIGAIVAAAVVVVAAAAWGVWTGIGGAAATMEASTGATQVLGDSATEVRWTVTGRPTAALVCAIEAQDAQGVVVGLVEVTVPVTGSANRSGDTVVRTVRRASSGLIASCRDA